MTAVMLPPTPKGWDPRRTHTGRCGAPAPPAPPAPQWRTCRACWGQAVILAHGSGGRGYYPCATCFGTGSEWR